MAALVTPLTDDGRLDHRSLERLIPHILDAGVVGLCPAGSTGEGPLLSRDLRIELVTATAAAAPAGTAVIPATVSVTMESTIEDLEAYEQAGATAALVSPPFYYPLSDKSVYRFFEHIAERSPLPLLLYNIPAMTKVAIPAPVAGDLAAHPRIVGMKDSSRDLEYFQSVSALASLHGNGEFALLTGSDTLLVASMAAGGTGTIAASVNLVPDTVVALYDAIRAEEWPVARAVQERLLAIVSACRRPGFPAGWKAALALAGLCSAHTAPPISPATPEATRRLADELTPLMGSDRRSP
ncbi:MAG: dihydrodipicolinate synthase family protein [Acidimicrobiales bacterium]